MANKKDKRKKNGNEKKDVKKKDDLELVLPPILVPSEKAPLIETEYGIFDLDNPVLPDWIDAHALASGGYPYGDDLDKKDYERELEPLQVELIKMQHDYGKTGKRLVAVFEGRDAAGKGGAISAVRENLNPRSARIVALPKPSETEAGQWYFQRYVTQMPASGEIVLFDRSWYNRAGVERVMGFSSKKDYRTFLRQAPAFEKMLVEAGITIFKFWLDIGQIMQLKQFHQRRHDPLKIWKLSAMDYAGMQKWNDYTVARDRMFAETDTKHAPWIAVKSNDRKRAHINVIRHMLRSVDYEGKDKSVIDAVDPSILGPAASVLGRN